LKHAAFDVAVFAAFEPDSQRGAGNQAELNNARIARAAAVPLAKAAHRV
jgi:hypothetical protein